MYIKGLYRRRIGRVGRPFTLRTLFSGVILVSLAAGLFSGPFAADQSKVPYFRSCMPERPEFLEFRDYLAGFYDRAELKGRLAYEPFELGMIGYYNLRRRGMLMRDSVLTIIDYTRPSTERRLVVIDMGMKEVIYTSVVAHGIGSGEACAESFSNTPGSLQTSIGFYVTGTVYDGIHGIALKLKGLESGFNDKATARSIVMHGAWYCSRDFIDEYGRLGRSWGCPALPHGLAKKVIDAAKGGTCLFAYYNDEEYLRKSPLLDIHGAVAGFHEHRGGSE